MKRILAATFLLIAASTIAFAQCSDADKKKLEEFDRAWGEASQRGDRTFMQNIYADDYTGLSPAGMLTKAQTIDAAVRDAERNRANPQNAGKVSHDYYMISCTPNTATITHRNIIMVGSGAKEQTFYTRSVHFLEKRGDRWQVVGNAGQPLQDGGMLLYMEREWNDASIKRDVAWFERNYADDYSSISSRTGALTNKADDIADTKNGKSTLEWAELSDLDARVEGNMAVVTGVNHVKGRDEQGKPFDRRVRFTDTFIKRDGRWQVWATQGTDIQK